jgi:PRC-barrel domain
VSPPTAKQNDRSGHIVRRNVSASPNGEKLGSVYDVMLNKATGQVAYAIMSFGGFLGMGESYHPLPWRALSYDTRQDGYVVDIDRGRLEGAPNYTASDAPNWSDRAYGQSVDRYYGY